MLGCHHIFCSGTCYIDFDVEQAKPSSSLPISHLGSGMLSNRLACDCQEAGWLTIGRKHRSQVRPLFCLTTC